MSFKRQLHAYCVGQAKSGTASLWGICRTKFRSEHEPELSEVLVKVQALSSGDISDHELVQWLEERDQRMQLDVDVGWSNYFLLKHLLIAFPTAKYIVLVRDCYTWIESVVGHMLTREIPADAREFMEFWFRTSEHPHGDGEDRLREHGLFSLDAYLHTWLDHITSCVSMIPDRQRLIIRTHELSRELPALADFLGIEIGTLDECGKRLNAGTWQGRIGELVDLALVEQKVNSLCKESMQRYFPEIQRMSDAYSLYY